MEGAVVAVWNPGQYLQFADWRTRPSHDLAARVAIGSPRRIVDLGCGPGNSSAVCALRWPKASILGVDSSPEMIEAARASYPGREWLVADIAAWARGPVSERCDIVFSSAALQWVDDHAALFPQLLWHLAPGGALAVQMPSYDAIPNRVMRELAGSEAWAHRFPTGSAKEWRSHSLEFYYETLAPHSAALDLWATDYLQIMPHFDAIVNWYKSTGLRPYLDAIDDEAEASRFLAAFAEGLRPHYPESRAGGVPFLFRRLFVVAYAAPAA